MNERITVTPSSGNVFADLGLPSPEERLVKAKLASRIDTNAPGITEQEREDLERGRLAGFTLERLRSLPLKPSEPL